MQGRGASLAALAGIALLALTCVHADHDETKDESSGFNTMATNLPDYGGDEWKACTPGISKWEDITSTYISDNAFKTGSLGERITSRYCTWICVKDACGSGSGPGSGSGSGTGTLDYSEHFCYVWDEFDNNFVPWGKNVDLHLVTGSAGGGGGSGSGSGSSTGVTVSVTFSVFDAKTSQDISNTASGLTITVDGIAYDCGKGECDGNLDVEEGSYSVEVAASGYITFSDTIPMLPNGAENNRHIDFYLVPDPAGNSRMVLRWGETPADLDFYVIPKQTDSVGLWKTHGCWDENGNYCDENGSWNCDNLDTVRPFMHKDERYCDAFTQPPALHWDVTGEGFCDCLPFNDPNCEATCFIETASSGAGYDSKLALDRDDTEHAPYASNGPEMITLDQLIPGEYEVWVNAYGRDEEEDQYSVDDGSGTVNYFTDTPFHVEVYLGSSIGQTSLVATVSHSTASSDKWFHAGTLTSTIADGKTCDGANDKMQQFPYTDPLDPKATPITIDVCYSWQTVGEIKAYPLGEGPARRALEAQVAKRKHAKGAHVRPSIAAAVAARDAQRAQRGAKAAKAAKP